ncbi:MAG: bifunctional diaminohydroxyphosphoribosylaminopyrimidine deaminase/5-amino-6-(5-phosphoribosylamino)uracil reductase RibD [Myxococcales bacterium]|nr:bifunctional diaminohydroxyphosphoribosylaminopyrimidine deaminase/5-amino-6-(5-phosphoribosylamino)uracil reductase RibD [Myxococcales bacterium]
MQLALREARRALGRTRPNPAVGAVVVRAGKVVATGFHHRAGQPHAEAEALTKAGAAARGATLYVTLEPCCHTGRTGPCTEAILAAGVRRVVVGCPDANPKVDGKGTRQLRAAGVTVDVGCREEECQELNRAFFCWVSEGRPLITLKYASTLDGIIGDLAPNPSSRAVTGPKAQTFVHQMRALHHAILVGRGTVQADDPQLTVRTRRLPRGGSRSLLRVVLDSQLRVSPRARLFAPTPDAPPPLVLGLAPTNADEAGLLRRRRALERAGAEVVLLPRRRGLRTLAPVLALLAARGVQSLLVEGGQHVLSAFISQSYVDDVAAFVAPRLAGGGVTVTTGRGRGLAATLPLGFLAVRRLGPDLLVTGRVAHPGRTAETSR